MQTSTCRDCGAPIRFVKWSNHYYKWVSGSYGKPVWKCGDDPNLPVKSHHPADDFKYAEVAG